MADNTTLNSGTGGDVISTDDIAGVKVQRVKVQFGADGAATDVAAAAPLPIQLTDGVDTALVTGAGALLVDGSGVTQPVSAASLPLPTGAATAALQLADGHNVTVDNAAGASAVNVQDGGNSLTVDGTVAVTGVSTLAEQQTQTTALQLIDDAVMTLGTTTYAEATTKGTLAAAVRRDADTSAVNTDNEAAPLLVNAIGALKVEIFDGGDSHTVDGTVTANLAAGTNTNEVVGDVAQDIPVAGNPVLVGARASDAEPTAMSADGDTVYVWADRSGRTVVTEKCSSVAQSSVAGSATSVTLLASNVARLGAVINNDSTAILYVKLGATASTTSYTYKLFTDGVCEIPYGYTGVIDGIWASAAGNARITEMS